MLVFEVGSSLESSSFFLACFLLTTRPSPHLDEVSAPEAPERVSASESTTAHAAWCEAAPARKARAAAKVWGPVARADGIVACAGRGSATGWLALIDCALGDGGGGKQGRDLEGRTEE